MISNETNRADKLSGTPLGFYWAVMGGAVAAQDQYMRVMRGLMEQSPYMNPLSATTSQNRAQAGGGGLPIENYDRLTVEEITDRLSELDAGEVEELKAYEKSNKNRATLVERFDRSLI